MTKDDIIRMGHKADAYANCKWDTETPAQDWKQYRDERFANLVAAHERDQLFTVPVAARKWAALQEEGYKMEQIRFARDGKTGTIDDWGKVLWEPVEPADKDAEIARLTACLKAANASAEKFEREWYLRGDEIEAMQAQPEQEPVAWMVYTQDGRSVYVTDNPTDIQEGQRALPLYTKAQHD